MKRSIIAPLLTVPGLLGCLASVIEPRLFGPGLGLLLAGLGADVVHHLYHIWREVEFANREASKARRGELPQG